jgi:hypothetical protein
MPGQKREARLRADVPGIHVLTAGRGRAWMAGRCEQGKTRFALLPGHDEGIEWGAN